ncbi:hypothetical protein DV872_23750 [Oceanispirochaeta sp. M1]|nr:hypothetical protein DV872_23750 [Oceanispirochaeta sp. M1]
MHKLGLKIWSINTDNYLNEAKRLIEEGYIDYIELYYVPGTENKLAYWEKLSIPYVIHSPHMAHGFNLADKYELENNLKIFKKVQTYADALTANKIIVHCEANGSIDETIKQLNQIDDDRILIENVPAIVSNDTIIDHFIGVKPEEIEYIKRRCNVGFVLDIGHAIAAAVHYKIDYWNMIDDFLILKPEMLHLSDTDTTTPYDDHFNIGKGNMDFNKLKKRLIIDYMISIETNKKSLDKLDDFNDDVKSFRRIFY